MNESKKQKFRRIAFYGAKRVAASAIGLAFALPVLAQTADPGVDAINALQTRAETYTAAAFAVAVFVAGAFWGIAMMKKAFSKAK